MPLNNQEPPSIDPERAEEQARLLQAAAELVDLERDLQHILDPAARDEASALAASIRAQLSGAGGRVSLASIRTQLDAARQHVQQSADPLTPTRANHTAHLAYELTAAAQARVMARSGPITASNMRQFVSSFIDDDVPAAARERLINDRIAILQTAHGQQVQRQYNAASEESRQQVLVATEATEARIERIQDQPRFVADRPRLVDATVLGATADAQVQESVEQIENGTATAQDRLEIDQANSRQRVRIIENIDEALTTFTDDERTHVAVLGGPKAITIRGAEVARDRERRGAANRYIDAVESGRSLAGFTEEQRRDALAYRAFTNARDLATMELIAEQAIQMDLERTIHRTPLGYGVELEERTQRVFELIKDNPEFEGVNEQWLLRRVRTTLHAADEQGHALKDLKTLSLEDRLKMTKEIDIASKRNTAANRFAQGIYAMATDDTEGAERAAVSVGRGVKNTLEEAGLDRDDAQRIGASVSQALRGGARAVGAAHDVAEDVAARTQRAQRAADEAVRGAGRWIDDRRDQSADAVARRDNFGRELNQLLGSFQADRRFNAMFDKDRDGKIELHELRDVLKNKYGIDEIRDVSTDGDISRQELMSKIARGPVKAPQR